MGLNNSDTWAKYPNFFAPQIAGEQARAAGLRAQSDAFLAQPGSRDYRERLLQLGKSPAPAVVSPNALRSLLGSG